MLKKLVKYGNSNAIILDKAILELLEIEEGSIIKIKTDGKSIIITPQEKAASLPVHETFTHNQATVEVSLKEGFTKHKGLGTDERERFEVEYRELIKKHQSLVAQVHGNEEFRKQAAQLSKKMSVTSPEYLEAFAALSNSFSPELMAIQEAMKSIGAKYQFHSPISAEQQKALEQEFFAVHNKNASVYKAYGEILNNPEYQHQAQLIAERYGADKSSAEYLDAMAALNESYLPGFKKAQDELKVVSDRFASKNTK